jgi:hypothetical protein
MFSLSVLYAPGPGTFRYLETSNYLVFLIDGVAVFLTEETIYLPVAFIDEVLLLLY